MRSVKGALTIARRAKADDKIGLLAPKDNAAEAAVVKGLQVIPIQNLREAVGFLEGEVKISPTRVDLARLFDQPREDELDSFSNRKKNPRIVVLPPPTGFEPPANFRMAIGKKASAAPG